MTPESEWERNCARMFTGLQVPQRVVPLTDKELAAKVAEIPEKSDE